MQVISFFFFFLQDDEKFGLFIKVIVHAKMQIVMSYSPLILHLHDWLNNLTTTLLNY